jgi:cell division protein ftsA
VEMNNVFGLDIGTRNVVGTVGYQTDDREFVVTAQYVREHETRAMLDGQIHDIGRVAKTIKEVKDELEKQTGQPLEEVCIAAAGRVLKTVTTHVEYEYAQESVVTGEDVHTLNLLGIEKAQEALKEVNDTSYKFYCVGYSTVKFFLNDEVFISLEGHKANKIGEDIIVTFLPEDVVDGLYAAVGQAGLSVANMTLEPIAAINVAIPENYRMLNIALVDVGAGTSDISITRDGSIIAYGMIPHAGDEMTEVIVQHFLVDFNMAESIKLQSTTSDTVTYKDIMSIEHTIPAQDVWDVAAPVVDNIAQEISAKIRELNGDKTVSACFVVGGGGKIHGFTEKLAEDLDLPEERVALRGEEVLGDVTFEQEDIKKDPLLVTPIGICLNYYEQRNNFIMVRFNGERIKLYDNNRLTIVDAALQAGFSNDELFPKRGTPINFTVNGVARLVRGEAGEGAVVNMNGKPASINTPLEPNSEIVIEPSTAGEAAEYKISQLDEYNHSVITFIINGRKVSCPRFVQVNGRLEPEDYSIRENDVIETRNYYTVRQIAQFMDLVIDTDQMIFVNNEEADLDTLVYENFSVEWKTDEYGVARIDNNNYNDTQESDSDDASVLAEQDANSTESDNTVTRTSEQMMNQVLDELHDEFAKEAEASAVPENELPKNDIQEEIHEEDSSENTVTVIVNGEPVELSGKDTYIFVDIFTHISFDLQAGKGRAIATIINGRDAQFSEELHEGDQIELYWKEN